MELEWDKERFFGCWEARFAGQEPMGLGPGVERRLSIIMPCYNVEAYIDHCMESLVGQSLGLHRMEIVAVDDASTDGTLEKLKSWEARYPENILLIPLEENMRQGGAKNVGLAHSTGEYIGFMDSDDWAEPQMYAVLLEAFALGGDVDMAACGRKNVFSDGTNLLDSLEKEGIWDLTATSRPNFTVGTYARGGLVQKVFRRQALDRAGVWFPQGISYEDNYFAGILNYYLRKIHTYSEPLYNYRIREDSTIHQKNASHYLDRLKSECMRLEALEQRGLASLYIQEIEFHFLELFFVNTIWGFLCRFDHIPSGIVPFMVETVSSHFPGWKENPMVIQKDWGDWGRLSLRLLDLPFASQKDKEVIELAVEALRQALVRWREQVPVE